MRPVLCFGTRLQAKVTRAGEGWNDAGLAYNLRARTDRVALAGAGGECIFTLLYLPLAFTASLTLYVRAIVDGVPLETIALALVANAGPTRQQVIREIGLSVPNLDGVVEVGRNAARGTWFAVEVWTAFEGNAAPIEVGMAEVEYEVVRESKA